MTGDGTRITAGHLVRAACVYVRQSTPGQVRNNLESKRLQYALQTRAKELGWHTVETIDEDLGRSGGGGVERPGFQKLLTAVSESRIGIVLSVDASRLARNAGSRHHGVPEPRWEANRQGQHLDRSARARPPFEPRHSGLSRRRAARTGLHRHNAAR